MVSLPAWTSSAGILSSTADFHFFSDQLPHRGSVADHLLGVDCSPVLRCHHNIQFYSSYQYSVHLLKISYSSVSISQTWIVEVRSFTDDMLCCCCFCSGRFQSPGTEQPIQSSFAFFAAFWILLFASLYYLLLLLLHPASSSNLSSHHRDLEHLWWPTAFSCYILSPSISLVASVTVVIMVLMSLSPSLSPMSGANFPPTFPWKMQATSGSLYF